MFSHQITRVMLTGNLDEWNSSLNTLFLQPQTINIYVPDPSKSGSVKDSLGGCGIQLQYNAQRLTEIFTKSSRPEAFTGSPDNSVEFALS